MQSILNNKNKLSASSGFYDFKNIRKDQPDELWNRLSEQPESVTPQMVKKALLKNGNRTIEDFAALLSPAATDVIEDMAAESRALTLKRFGKTIQLYVPLYLSNFCINKCKYCGFSSKNKQPRKVLSMKEITTEGEAIKKAGFDHILLVSGESPAEAGVEYFEKAVKTLRPFFSNIALEIQPLDTDEYKRLIRAGADCVYIYQETYHEKSYRTYHPAGPKRNYHYRLDTPDRLGKSGIHKIGLGILLGLDNWRTDSLFTAFHLRYLQKKYWQTRFSISFPRLRPASGVSPEAHTFISDAELAQLIFAWRLFDEDLEISLSTREPAFFRDHMLGLGITSMSAGSLTTPGGYASKDLSKTQDLSQFEVGDKRSAQEIKELVVKSGYDPVWKDWDKTLH